MNKKLLYAVAAMALMIALAAAAETYMGRAAFGPDGRFGLWESDINSRENSQRLADPYSFTHFSHGLIFFALAWLVAHGLPVEKRFLMAVALESAWEIAENSPFMIERYRAATISLGYFGDSVVNSAGDILSMALGFVFAAAVPVRVSVAAFIFLELALLFAIRDNLVLNVVMLVYPLQAIKNWQIPLPLR